MPQPNSFFLLSSDFMRHGELPVLRRGDKLFYTEGAHQHVLEACRRFGIRLELLADHFSISRPALTLILRGCDPVPHFLHPQLNLFVQRSMYLTPPPRHVPPPHAEQFRTVQMGGSNV